MTQNVNEHFDKWKADYCLRNKLDHEFLFVGCRDAYLAGYALASHAPSERSCVVCGALLLPPSEPPHCEDCQLIDGEAPSEAAAQPTKRQQIDALVKAEYEDGLYDRLPEIEHNDH